MNPMQQNKQQQAAQIILNAWLNGQCIDALPDDCRPETLAQAYGIQAALAAASGQAVAGWKIAATSAAGQRHIGVDGPLAGRLLADNFFYQPATLPLGANRMRVAEAEFAFRMAVDLAPRDEPYTQEEVMAAVAALYPAIEIPDSRFADFANAGGIQLVADNACARLFVLGDEVKTDWRSVDLAGHEVVLAVDNEIITRGKGADALGDPRIALSWIANNHVLQGEGLKAGQVITTGVCGKPAPIRAGANIVADFGRFGRVEVAMADN